jgi:P4 family phage/plasmid primase-like protien
MFEAAKFQETINYKALIYIRDHFKAFEKNIQTYKPFQNDNINYQPLNILSKIIDCCNEDEDGTGHYSVYYKKGRNSNNVGRWFCTNQIGIQCLPRPIRHTICDGLYYDLDIVNAHPVLLYQLCLKNNIECKYLKKYVERRKEKLEKFSEVLDIPISHIKQDILHLINGSSRKFKKHCDKIGCWSAMMDEFKRINKQIAELPEFKDIYDNVCKFTNENIFAKTMNRVLCNIENNCLEAFITYLHQNHNIPIQDFVLIFDGCQIPMKYEINDDIFRSAEQYIKDTIGFAVTFVIKPFDEKIELPSNYKNYISNYSASFPQICHRFDDILENKTDFIDKAIISDGTHYDVGNVISMLCKDFIICDDYSKPISWFYCNENNVWVKDNCCLQMKKILPKYGSQLFLERSRYYSNLAMKEKDENISSSYQKKAQQAIAIAYKLKNVTYIKNIIEACTTFLNSSKFYETKLDSKTHIFAFNNCLFDFRFNKIRDIQPDDYVFTTTGYDYVQEINEEIQNDIWNFFKSVYPNEEMMYYIFDSIVLCMNPERPTQEFYTLTGNGSNGKSLLAAFIQYAFGDYAIMLNPATITRPPQRANETTELIHTKGKRFVYVNEAPSGTENKLQTSILKTMAGNVTEKIKARDLYSSSIEFNIQFVTYLIYNDNPQLSSAEPAVARRLRIIDHQVKFVENAPEDNVYIKPINTDLPTLFSQPEYYITFIQMLLKRWNDKVHSYKSLVQPQDVIEKSKEYIDENNEVLGWVFEDYEKTNSDKDFIKSSDLFSSFKTRTKSTMTASVFKNRMEEIGFKSKRTNKGVIYQYIAVKDVPDDEN